MRLKHAEQRWLITSMRKSPSIKNKAKLQALLCDMEYLFGLQNYDRTISYEDTEAKESGEYAASIIVEEDYQRIHIKIYPCFWNATPKNQAGYILHEFCHFLTDSLSSLTTDLMNGNFQSKEHRRMAVEKSTSSVTNVIELFLSGKRNWMKKCYTKYYAVPAKKKSKKKRG